MVLTALNLSARGAASLTTGLAAADDGDEASTLELETLIALRQIEIGAEIHVELAESAGGYCDCVLPRMPAYE